MTLAYESAGQGIPLVLIHAFPLSSSMWKTQMKRLEWRARVIILDLPGFGQSPCESHASIPTMAKEIACLLDSLKLTEPGMIAGLSMGGYVALEFFRQFPKRVKALGLFSTRAGADTLEARDQRLKAAAQIQKDGLDAFVQKALPSLIGKTTLESNPGLIREISNMISSNTREGVAGALTAMAERKDSTDLLSSIRCPTLIIAGDEDTLIPYSEAEAMHVKITGSQFHLISKTGHLVNLEQPEAFHKTLENFLIENLKN